MTASSKSLRDPGEQFGCQQRQQYSGCRERRSAEHSVSDDRAANVRTLQHLPLLLLLIV